MIIRLEQQNDTNDIRYVIERAFGQPQEANIVDNLRKNCEKLISIVALDKGKIVGHILFSPVIIEKESRLVRGMGLAPIAVLPEYQRQGIGTQLVSKGIERLR